MSQSRADVTWRQALVLAVASAFPTRLELKQELWLRLGLNLDQIAPETSNLNEVVIELLQWAEAKGATDEVFVALAAANPGREDLRDAVERALVATKRERVENSGRRWWNVFGHGLALKFTVTVSLGVLVMGLVVFHPELYDLAYEPPQVAQSGQTPTGKTNEQLIAEHIVEGKTKLAAGDVDAAIAAAERALVIDQENPDALALKINAEEAKRAAPTPAPGPRPTPVPGPTPATPTPAPPTSTPTAMPGPTPGKKPGKTTKPGKTPDHVPSPYVQQRYAQGKAALERGRYAEATAAFEEVLQREAGYLDTQALLNQTRAAQKAKAVEALQAGQKLAESGDLSGARDQYARARALDKNTPGLEEALAALAAKMKDVGASAYRRARQYDAIGRSADAIPLYEQAVLYLPDSDPNKKTAQERLAVLKSDK